MTKRFVIQSLDRTHDRAGFSCGNERIDRAFRTTISQDVRRDFAKCFVAVESESGVLAGFYTLSSWSFSVAELSVEGSRRLPRYPHVPAVLLGWLGRDTRFAGTGVGSYLLFDALMRIVSMPTGVYAIVAHAIDEDAARFYMKYGFRRFPNEPNTLMITVSEIRELLNENDIPNDQG